MPNDGINQERAGPQFKSRKWFRKKERGEHKACTKRGVSLSYLAPPMWSETVVLESNARKTWGCLEHVQERMTRRGRKSGEVVVLDFRLKERE